MSDKTKKNWFRRHWIISIFLAILVVGVIWAMFSGESASDTINSNENSKQYTDEDLYTLIYLFVDDDSSYTDLQKKDEFKNYKGKWIRSSGIVKDIDEGLMGGITTSIEHSDNYLLNGATLYFDTSEKEKLLQIGKGGEINFEGRIEGYSSFIGIMIKDATLT